MPRSTRKRVAFFRDVELTRSNCRLSVENRESTSATAFTDRVTARRFLPRRFPLPLCAFLGARLHPSELASSPASRPLFRPLDSARYGSFLGHSAERLADRGRFAGKERERRQSSIRSRSGKEQVVVNARDRMRTRVRQSVYTCMRAIYTRRPARQPRPPRGVYEHNSLKYSSALARSCLVPVINELKFGVATLPTPTASLSRSRVFRRRPTAPPSLPKTPGTH